MWSTVWINGVPRHLLAKSSEILISSYCPQFVVQIKGFGSIRGLNDFSYTFKLKPGSQEVKSRQYKTALSVFMRLSWNLKEL